jgi:RND family efflux transporter MFP subunit
MLGLFCVQGEVVLLAGELRQQQGTVEPAEDIEMMAPIRELVVEMHVEEGDRIVKGDPLVSLRSDIQQLTVESLEQQRKKAEFDYKAAKALFEDDVQSENDALTMEVEFKRVDNQLSMAKADLRQRTLLAPFDGVVVRRFKDPGESIAESEPVLQVMRVDELKLLFHLEARLLPFITLGQKIPVSFPALPQVEGMAGTVHFIDPVVDARSGLFRVRLLLDNQKEQIKPGLRVVGSFPKPSASPATP